MQSIKTILFILLGMLLTMASFAQQEQIRLIDRDDNHPIVAATFEYGSQKGTSDENGVIRFQIIPNQNMKISHVSYGSWVWNDEEIQSFVKEKIFYIRSSTLGLQPVTVIALRPSHQPDDRVSLTHEERMQHDAAEILNELPGFSSIRKSGNYGFDPVFRGFKYEQLNIVLNGAQSATAACPNRMDPPTSQMAPNMMERVEILKGPHSLRYGPGIGATINFIPTTSQFTGRGVYGRLSSGFESNGNILRGEGQIGFGTETYDLSFFSSWSEGDDYQTGNGQRVPADFSRGSFGTNLGLKLSNSQQLSVSALYNRAKDADFPALAMDLRDDDTWMFNARHDIQIRKGSLSSWNTTIFGSFVDHKMNNLLKPLDPRTLNAETTAETYNYGGRTESVWEFSQAKLYAGADLRVEGATGTRTREFLTGPNAGNTVRDNAWQDGSINKTSLFAEYQLDGNSWSYIFSGRMEINHAAINDASAEFNQVYSDTEITQTNPSFSLGAFKLFRKNMTVGLWLGRAQRSGGLTERFINYFPVGQDPFEMLGNPNLDPEINNQIDLTFEWKTANAGINLDLFTSYLQDYISSAIDTTLTPRIPMSPGVRQFINISDAYKAGFELTWIQRLPVGLTQQLGIAYTYAQDLERDKALPEIPPLDIRFRLSGNYLKDRLTPEIMLRHALKQSRISQEYGETITPSFMLLDIKLGYQITDKLTFKTGVNNMFDQNYYEHLNRSIRGTNDPIFARGRNLFFSVDMNF